MVWLVLLWLLVALPAGAQVYRFRTYTSNSGLASNSVYRVFQDHLGYVWFATDGGASRYDGVAYTNYSMSEGLVDTSVRAFAEDRDGALWLGTKGGVSRFDGQRFTNFTTAEGLVHNEVRCALGARDGTLWFGTSRGLSHYDGKRFTNYLEGLPNVPLWTLHEDRAGRLWIGTRGGGLVRFDGHRFVRFGKTDGLPDDNVFDLAEDAEGGLWIATDGGLAHYDGIHFRAYTTVDGLGSDRVSSVLVDSEKRVWVGTFGGGVSRLQDGKFTVFDRRSGLPDDYVTSIFTDFEGNLWFSSMWSGAFRFGSERFTNYTVSSGLASGLVTGIAETPDDTLWFSSVNSGLSSLDSKGDVHRYGVKDGLLEERLFSLAIDSRGRVFAGGPAGVSYREGNQFHNLSLATIGVQDRINAIIEGPDGRIWFGSGAARSSGLVAWDGQRFVGYSTADGLAHNQVNGFARDRDGNLWIATENGLSRFDGKTFKTFGTAQGLPNHRVICAYQDSHGQLWVGTAEGLGRLEGASFRSWRAADGLPSSLIHTLSEHDGALWVGTAAGLAVWDGAHFRTFTVKDGLVSHEVATGSALVRRDGSLWFGTPEGAIRHQPGRDLVRELPPRMYVTATRARERLLAPAAAAQVAHDENSLTFEFLGLSFTHEDEVSYSYLLEGLDHEWSAPAQSRTVRYTNLDPGQYRFHVKARSAGGPWSDPATVGFQVLPPVWQTWWFRGLALAATLGLGFAAFRWRVRLLLERQRLRTSHLRGLVESIRVINSGLSLARVLENIAAESARLVGGDPGGIGLLQGGAVVFRRLWLNGRWEDADLSLPLGSGVAGRVASTGKTAVVDDPAGEPDTGLPAELRVHYRHGFMDVPIIDRSGKVVGVLDVRRDPNRPHFGPPERALIESLAHQAAIAIENAGLYGALAEKKVELAESLWAVEELFKHEQQLTRMLQELNDMKTNFMIVTAHEMRTPLTLLKGYHEALLEGFLGELTPSQAKSLGVSKRTVDRMISSFNEIIQMLELDQGVARIHPVSLDLEPTVRGVLLELEPFLERRRQTVEVVAEPSLPRVRADPEKLAIAVLNVVENAIKFTPDGGAIRIHLSRAEERVRLTVADTGVGIEGSELERVFERFYAGRDPLHHSSGTYQFKTRGTGLGLAIARGYIDALQGRIWAESEGPDTGSRFHIELPISPIQEQAAIA